MTSSSPKKTATRDIKKRFRTVAEALGANADKLLEEFMVGWLENIRVRANLDDVTLEDG